MIFNFSSGGGVGLNFAIQRYASEDALRQATPAENTIGVVTATQIPGYAISVAQPGATYSDIDMLDGVTLGKGYLGATGTVSGQTAANPELYTQDYIPVVPGTEYRWKYTVSASKSMYLSICEYTTGNKFKQRLVPLSSVTGTSQAGIYTPSADDVVSVRLSWRTFPSTTYTMEFLEHKASTAGIAAGTVWIVMGAASPAEFNALRKDAIQVCPISAKQYDGDTWNDVTAKAYQSSAWIPLSGTELAYEQGQYTALLATLSEVYEDA